MKCTENMFRMLSGSINSENKMGKLFEKSVLLGELT